MRPYFIVLLLLFTATEPVLFAQTSHPLVYFQVGYKLEQNFNSLPGSGTFLLSGKGPYALGLSPLGFTGMSGWELIHRSGTGANALFTIGSGTATSAGVYSVGNTASDRALGTLSAGTGVYSIGLIITNETGKTLQTVTGSFTAEQWRKGGSGNVNTWTGKLATGKFSQINPPQLTLAPSLNFSSIINSTGGGSLNGNSPENQRIIPFTIAGINWKPGEQLIIQWDDMDENGSDDLMAIDDFSFRADTLVTVSNQVYIDSLYSMASKITNADTISYAFKASSDITGLSISNFALQTQGLINTSITAVNGNGNDYFIKVYTGTGEGKMVLGISNNNNLIPGLSGLPFFSIDTQLVDKINPTHINTITNEASILKTGDTLILKLGFNELVHIDPLQSSQSIPIKIGSQIKQAVYSHGNQSQELFFKYKITSSDKDADGISFSNDAAQQFPLIKDRAENPAIINLDSTNLKRLRINAGSVQFKYPADTLLKQCNNRDSIDIANLLATDSSLNGEILQWQIIRQPSFWKSNQTSVIMYSTGGTLQPQSWKFTSEKVNKTDTLSIKVSNGSASSIKNIFLTAESWIGLIDSNWHNAGNWCNNSLPDENATVTLQSSAVWQPTLTLTHAIRNLIVTESASLRITGSLAIYGFIQADSNSIHAMSGNIEWKGNTTQSISGFPFKQRAIGGLILNNFSGASITDSVLIYQYLQLKSGTLKTNEQLYFKSAAIIQAAAQESAIIGKIFNENIFKQKPAGIYMAGHPFTDSVNINQWIPVPNMHVVSTTKLTDSSSIEAGWQSLFLDSTKGIWQPKHVVRITIEDTTNRSKWPDYLKGQPVTGNYNYPLGTGGNGFYQIINPYLSPVYSSKIVTDTGMSNYKYIWNPQLGKSGGYSTLPMNQEQILDPYASLILYADSAKNKELLFTEAAKSNIWSKGEIADYDEKTGYYVQLDLLQNNTLQDRLIIREQPGARNNKEMYDAVKLLNPGINFYSRSADNKKLAIDSRVFSEQSFIQLELSNLENGNYILKTENAFMPVQPKLVLYDNYTSRQLNLQKDSSLAFSINNDSASRSPTRFYIAKWAPKAIIPLTNQLTVKIYPNPSSSEMNVIINAAVPGNSVLRIYNMKGTLLKTIVAGTIQQGFIRIPISNLTNGQYLLQVTSGSHQQNIPFFKQ